MVFKRFKRAYGGQALESALLVALQGALEHRRLCPLMARRRRSKGGSGKKSHATDDYTRRAKSQGYPARSVFKLEEIDRRCKLLKHGQRVLDLGASPGSWTLYAAKKVGSKGSVLAIDLNPLRCELPEHVEFRQGDMYAETQKSLGGLFDVVLSDMAPKTTGQREGDMFRSYELVMGGLSLATGTLKPGGHFVAKIFQGAEFEDARNEFRKHFEQVRVIRPKATRDISYEVFLVGLRFRGES